MRKIVGKSAVVLLYILLLCVTLKLKISQLFNLPLIGLCLIGGVILCLPLLKKGMSWHACGSIFGRNALMAGYLEAFMLLFASMNESLPDDLALLPALALDLRPILYGFICHLIFCREQKKEVVPGPNLCISKPKLDLSNLTKREHQIVNLIQKGLSNREIAEELFISETTVKKHVSNIFEKTGVSSRKEL